MGESQAGIDAKIDEAVGGRNPGFFQREVGLGTSKSIDVNTMLELLGVDGDYLAMAM